jgi:hypothetical protein
MDTTQSGRSTTSLIFRSPATLHSAYASCRLTPWSLTRQSIADVQDLDFEDVAWFGAFDLDRTGQRVHPAQVERRGCPPG